MGVKGKILSVISFTALTVALILVGIWAVTEINFKVSGNIEYIAPVVVPDASEYSYLTLSYDDATMTASVTDCDTSVTSVEIPARIKNGNNNYTVTSIAGGSSGASGGAFYGCSALTSITVPDTVTSIGAYAFLWCSGLTNITIPDSVTSIGSDAFAKCTSLTNITIPKSITSIENNTFAYCTSLTNITIPKSITSIGEMAFYGCSALTSITVPDTVTSIGAYAFLLCSGLTNITIPDSVTSIGSGAFAECTSLEIFYIDSEEVNVESILSNYVEYVYVKEDIQVTSSYLTEITSDVEGYKKHSSSYYSSGDEPSPVLMYPPVLLI